jgi:Tol biopolymer transport system component
MRLTERWVDANVGPVWSPDGKSIAFKKKRAGNDPIFDLVIRFLETGEERKFVTGQIQGGHPDWFRDSKSLLTGRAPAAGRPGSPLPTQYFRLDVHTGERSPLPDIFQSANALSSDNKTLYVSTGPDPSNFLGTNRYSEVDLESGKERIIFTAPDPEEQTYGIGLSPDGRILAGFLFRKASPPQRPQPQARLFRVGVDGKDFRELYSFPAGPGQLFQEIEWSADGKYLFFMQPRAAGVQRWKVLRISSEGGEPRETGLELSGPTTTASFDISPDGKQVAYATEQPRSSEMWELQNVLSVLDR